MDFIEVLRVQSENEQVIVSGNHLDLILTECVFIVFLDKTMFPLIIIAAISGVIVIPLLGFTTGGIVAGSIAAAWQSGIGNVVAGSLFSVLQSLTSTRMGQALIGIGCIYFYVSCSAKMSN